jgi:type I restriction enzyme R subunit
LLKEYIEARQEREKRGFDLNTFTIYWVLKRAGIAEPETVAPALNEAFENFPNHAHNPSELRQLKALLYKVLLPVAEKEQMVELVEQLLRLKRT